MTKLAICTTLCLIAFISVHATALACACGCNVFTVGSRWSMPTRSGFETYLQYNYMDQSRNWGKWASAPPETNPDQEIRTHFYTVGVQYMPGRNWGITMEAPLWDRYFRTLDDDGKVESVDHTSFGDIRLTGMYTGLSEDMSTGVQFGLKLPTGAFDESLLDRDTQIGTGTTDLLLGGYQMGQENGWGWYAQLMWQHALNARDGYRPGDSFDLNIGVHYDGLLASLPVPPTLQVAGSFRGIDGGNAAEPENTGYERVYVCPGVQVAASRYLSFYSDIKIPVMTHVRGVQLVAPTLVGLTMSYSF
jgi:hypothetical protein